jgi:hypothetical protein
MLTHGQLHRCSPKGEIFVMYPRADAGNPHASYHLDGTYHHKSYGSTGFAKQSSR